MGGCFGCNSASFAFARAANIFQWYDLESTMTSLSDGVTTMHCWVPKKTKNNKNPPLVLLHGFGLQGLSWIMQIPSLSQNFDLYIPDLVFFGKSCSTGPGRSEFFQAECVMELLRTYNVTEFDIVGTSYGGFVAYRMAHMYPESVQRVILSSSAPNKDPVSDEKLISLAGVQSINEFLLPTSVQGAKTTFRCCFHKLPWLPDFAIKDYVEFVYCTDGLKEKQEVIDGMILGTARSPELPKINQDVLLLWGVYDKVFEVELAYRLKGDLGNNAQIVVIKDAAHLPQLEKPGEYNKIVTTYLQRP